MSKIEKQIKKCKNSVQLIRLENILKEKIYFNCSKHTKRKEWMAKETSKIKQELEYNSEYLKKNKD